MARIRVLLREGIMKEHLEREDSEVPVEKNAAPAAPDIIVMGSFVADLMGRGHALPVPGQTVKGHFFKVGPGGKGSNQAVAAARAGGQVAMVTRLGRDAFGDMALATWRAEGIDTSQVLLSDSDPTGAALILVEETGGQNAIMVIPGACGAIPTQAVASALLDFRGARVLVLQFETNFDAFETALREGSAAGMITIVNPAPAAHLPEELFPLVDYFTPNETEAEALSGVEVKDVASAEKAAAVLHEKGARAVIITLGEKGCLVSLRGFPPRLVPAFPVEALDTTGAGDAFTGAFALALSEKRDVHDAARFACAAAALSVTKLGTAPAMPQRSEIDAFLASFHCEPQSTKGLD